MYSMGNMINKKSSFYLIWVLALHSPSGCWGHSSRAKPGRSLSSRSFFPSREDKHRDTSWPPGMIVLRKEARGRDAAGCWSQGPEGLSGGDNQGRSESWALDFLRLGEKFGAHLHFSIPFHIKNYLLEEDFLKIFIYLHQVLIAACQIFVSTWASL